MALSLSSVFAQETGSGTYRVQYDGRPAGIERFNTANIPQGFLMTSVSETQTGGTAKRIATSSDFRDSKLRGYHLEINSGNRSEKYTFQFTPFGVIIDIELNGKKTRRWRTYSGDIVLLDRDVWHHYFFLLSRYDLKKLGKQRFRVFIPQAAFREYSAEVEYKGRASIRTGEQRREGNRFTIILADGFEVNAIADQTGMPLSVEIPDEKKKAVLEQN